MRFAFRRTAATLAIAVGPLVAFACGDETILHGLRDSESSAASTGASGTGGGHAHGSASSTGTGGAAAATGGSGGQGGEGGGEGGAASGGGGAEADAGPPMCKTSSEVFAMELDVSDGQVLSCMSGGGSRLFQGQVMSNGAGVIVVDGCDADDTCMMSMTYNLTVTAPGLTLNIPMGDDVEIEAEVDFKSGGCAQRLEIREIPSWAGVQNAAELTSPDSPNLLSAADGTYDAAADSPFVVTRVALDCNDSEIEEFSLAFSSRDNPDTQPLIVPQQQTMTWSIDAMPPQSWLVTNLRSYRITNTPTNDEYGFWLTPAILAQPQN